MSFKPLTNEDIKAAMAAGYAQAMAEHRGNMQTEYFRLKHNPIVRAHRVQMNPIGPLPAWVVEHMAAARIRADIDGRTGLHVQRAEDWTLAVDGDWIIEPAHELDGVLFVVTSAAFDRTYEALSADGQ